MDLNINKEQEQEEGYGVFGSRLASAIAESDDKVRTTQSTLLEYESAEKKQNIREADCDDNSRHNVPSTGDVLQNPSHCKLCREERPSSALPPPPPPPVPLPALPPEWKEALDAGTGQRYYYNVQTYESSWERPRLGKIFQPKDGELEDSSTGVEDGAPGVEPAELENGEEFELTEVKKNIRENDSDIIPSPSTSYSAKIQEENDSHSEKKSRWRLLKFRSGRQSGSNYLNPPSTPCSTDSHNSLTNTTPLSHGDKWNKRNGSIEDEKEAMELELLKKVPIFELLEDDVLSAISDRLSLKLYSERSEVFHEKEPIEHMLFIVQGNLECREKDGSISQLKKGDFCGEELLFRYTKTVAVCASKTIHRGKHPLSSRTIECVTPVEALSLDSEALKYITTHHKASFASPLVQGAVRYFSRYGWSLAATNIQRSWTSSKEKAREAQSTSKFDNSSEKKRGTEEQGDKVCNRQSVPPSEDFTDNLNSSSPLHNNYEVPNMEVLIHGVLHTANSIRAPPMFHYGKLQRNNSTGTEKKTRRWRALFQSNGDHSGKKIKSTKKEATLLEHGADVHNPGTSIPSDDLNITASSRSRLLGEDELMTMDLQINVEDISSPLPISSLVEPGKIEWKGETQTGNNLAKVQLGKEIEYTEKKDNTEVHDDDASNPQTIAPSQDLRDTHDFASPNLDENVLMPDRNVDREAQVPAPSGSGKTEQENDSHSGKKIRRRTILKRGGDQNEKISRWRSIFKSGSGDLSVSTLELIKKVPIFALLEDYVLEAICARLSLKRYTKSSEVFRKEESVKLMLFIVRGKLECRGDDGTCILRFREGDFCGEELLSWCTDLVGISTLKKIHQDGRHPLSSRTIQCLTAVEGFTLGFQALEDITSQFKGTFRSPSVQGAVRYFSADWRVLAATRIQKEWRSRKTRIGADQDWRLLAATRIPKEWRSRKTRIGADQVESNELSYEHRQPGNATPDHDTEQENSSSGTQEAPSYTELSKLENCVGHESTEKDESIKENGDDAPTPKLETPFEVLRDTTNGAHDTKTGTKPNPIEYYFTRRERDRLGDNSQERL